MSIAYVPSGLDLPLLLVQNPPNFKADLEDFYYIIGLIVKLKAAQKSNFEEDDSDFVPINAQILQRRVRLYNRYIEHLLALGIIDRDYWVKGSKSYGYRLTEQYESTEFVPVSLSKKSLVRKMPEEVRMRRKLDRDYGYLTKWFNPNLKIDFDGAVQCLEDLYRRDVQAMSRSKAAQKRYMRQIGADKIFRGYFDYHVDGNVKRFHSNLTNLKSELRNFLTYDGKRLSSVDVTNSQPFISTIFFNPSFYEESRERFTLYSLSEERFREIQPVIPQITSLLTPNTSPIMLVKSDEIECENEFELYFTLVDKGRLYDFLSAEHEKRSGLKLDVRDKDDRKKIKEAVFLTFFSKNSYLNQKDAEMKRLFRDVFPTVYAVFSLLKKVDHCTLATIMQQVESEIVLRRAAKTIARTHPKLPIFTIHDNIVTHSENVQVAWEALKLHFQEAIGLEPSLGVESWE